VAAFMGYENLFAVQGGRMLGAPGAMGDGGGSAPVPAGTDPRATHLAWRPAGVPVVAPDDALALPGRVLARSYLGESVQYQVQTVLGPVKGTAAPDAVWNEGDAVGVLLQAQRAAAVRSSA